MITSHTHSYILDAALGAVLGFSVVLKDSVTCIVQVGDRSSDLWFTVLPHQHFEQTCLENIYKSYNFWASSDLFALILLVFFHFPFTCILWSEATGSKKCFKIIVLMSNIEHLNPLYESSSCMLKCHLTGRTTAWSFNLFTFGCSLLFCDLPQFNILSCSYQEILRTSQNMAAECFRGCFRRWFNSICAAR